MFNFVKTLNIAYIYLKNQINEYKYPIIIKEKHLNFRG